MVATSKTATTEAARDLGPHYLALQVAEGLTRLSPLNCYCYSAYTIATASIVAVIVTVVVAVIVAVVKTYVGYL